MSVVGGEAGTGTYQSLARAVDGYASDSRANFMFFHVGDIRRIAFKIGSIGSNRYQCSGLRSSDWQGRNDERFEMDIDIAMIASARCISRPPVYRRSATFRAVVARACLSFGLATQARRSMPVRLLACERSFVTVVSARSARLGRLSR